ncbi:hypothetical protein H7J87_15285 [Mycolicibacterium wolinskyi]|uniref:Uncharacterized protein n=1 Tax=Mycolicibacterium wolinskyi TaxID=59750 RepID=A0A1X2F9F9_9MYCO|nr:MULTISPECIES: hypothetical protein [Mycolicibacterium]MCV7286690.1 hypothetical protein [Mycolicibacterium wolinskyi]MCV7293670.1 hypothetical protein [Mycolicibacterium goodii]ORX14609.1 hypothetical protein AWC31_25845 [Mycolicibacterium wolinskyi]
MKTAGEASDTKTLADLTCPQYRASVSEPTVPVPPVQSLATAEQIAADGFADALSEQLTADYPRSSEQTITQLVDAVIRQDQEAFGTALLTVVRENTIIDIVKVDDLKVEGNSASARVTTRFSFGTDSEQSKTRTMNFEKAGNDWQLCSPIQPAGK